MSRSPIAKLLGFSLCFLSITFCYGTSAFAQTYGPVRYGQTLWHIARQMRPNFRVSVAQAAVAIWEHNLTAFQHGNIHGLMADYSLQIPPQSVMTRLPDEQAMRIVTQQDLAWQKALQREGQFHGDLAHQQTLSLNRLQTNLYHLQHLQKKLFVLQSAMRQIDQSIRQYDARILTKQHSTPVVNHPPPAPAPTHRLFNLLTMLLPINLATLPIPHWFFYLLIILAAMLLLLLCATFLSLLRHIFTSKCFRSRFTSCDGEGEYDFLASQESIATQLDLGRAYIAMEDFNAARQVLKNVLQKGNDAQKKEAEHLLKSFEKT